MNRQKNRNTKESNNSHIFKLAKLSRDKFYNHTFNNFVQSKIDWKTEIPKAILTSFLVILVATFLQWIIFCCSPGEYKDQKLYTYLKRIMIDKLDIPGDEECFSIDRVLDSKEDILIVSGKYKDNKTEDYSGCYVFVFERSGKSFWNVLVGTEAGYKISFYAKTNKAINYDYCFECEEYFYDDLDGDKKEEALFWYRCNYADRITYFPIILQNQEGDWRLISPDFSRLDEDIVKQKSIPIHLLLDCYSFSFTNLKETETIIIYGLSHAGEIRRVDNPIWGGYDWLYYITANDGHTGLLNSDKTVLVMERITNHGIYKDSNWNGGNIIYSSTDDIDQYNYDDYWGSIGGENVLFYGIDQ